MICGKSYTGRIREGMLEQQGTARMLWMMVVTTMKEGCDNIEEGFEEIYE